MVGGPAPAGLVAPAVVLRRQRRRLRLEHELEVLLVARGRSRARRGGGAEHAERLGAEAIVPQVELQQVAILAQRRRELLGAVHRRAEPRGGEAELREGGAPGEGARERASAERAERRVAHVQAGHAGRGLDQLGERLAHRRRPPGGGVVVRVGAAQQRAEGAAQVETQLAIVAAAAATAAREAGDELLERVRREGGSACGEANVDPRTAG